MKTSCKNLSLLLALMVGPGLITAGRVMAQTLTTLHNFTALDTATTTNSDGAYPSAGLILSGNTLYGMAPEGGGSGFGTVFKVNGDGTGFTNLHSFTAPSLYPYTNSDGAYPYGGLILSGNTLYGTASEGGSSGNGTVFKINTDGTGFTTLYSFTATAGNTSTNSDGTSPHAELILSGSTLYGTARYGGRAGAGTVFAVNINGTGFTNLHSFTATSGQNNTNRDGAYPVAGLISSGNTLYGTANRGGSSGNGTVFKVNTDGTGFTNLHSFTAVFFPNYTNSDGTYPTAALLLSGNTLYGTASRGGSSGGGTVFKVNTDGTGFANLHNFTDFPDGFYPYSGLVLSGTTFYGTANSGGSSGYGTVFAVNIDGTGFTNFYSFTDLSFPSYTNSDGAYPRAGLILSGNTLYGTASGGGSSGNGTIFSLSLPPPPQLTTLHNFSSAPNDGHGPQGGLVVLGNRLFGAGGSGGNSGVGTVFALNTDGTDYSTLYSLVSPFNFDPPDSTNTDGAYPDVTVVLSGDTLFGAAYWGGTNGNGTVFKVNTNGTGFTILHSFAAGSGFFPFNYTNSDGVGPEGGLVISGDTLYGTCEKGGTSGNGAVYRLNTDGTGFTNLHSFTGGSDGSVPEALIISGNTLYGTTMGWSGYGTVYKVNTDGSTFTILHTFTVTNFTPFPGGGPGAAPIYTNSDGIAPTSLTLSGNTLYGTAYAGGSWGNGTVFALNTDGSGFTNLHIFAASQTNNAGDYANSEGAHPIGFSGLVLSGNTLYGTANYGGSSGNGTVFALKTDGSGFATLHSFSARDPVTGFNHDGANPYAGLVLSGNTLYGTANNGGSAGDGTVFSLRLPDAPPQLRISRVGPNVVLTWPINAAGFTLQSTTDLASPAVWSAVSPDPVLVNGENAVTNLISGTRKFYRLSK